MRSCMLGGVATAMIALMACSGDAPSGPIVVANDDDFALLAFGEAGGALEGTLGPQGPRPYDGRTCGPQFPEALQLTEEQKAAIAALRSDFREAHQAELDALRALFEQARAARESGATREEVHAILQQGRPIIEALRTAVQGLHLAIRAVLTAEQLEWLQTNRPRLPRPLRHSRP